MDVEIEGATEMSARLGRAAAALVAAETAVVERAAFNIKKDARGRVSTARSWRRLASTINYDKAGLTATVGYDDRGQGELAGVAEFGSSRHAPHPALMPAAAEEAPRFEKAALEAAAKVIGAAL